MMKKLILAMLCTVMSVGLSVAQTKKVSGTVFSADDGEAVIGATVMAKGTSTGTITDYNGEFDLQVPTSATTLVVSYIGMESQEIAAGQNLRITLASSSEMLDEVLVVAYGTAKKSSFTGAADVVKSERLDARTVANISKALEGTVAGVQTTSGGGQPGSGAKIIIRGIGSINANTEPLYVLDGTPYDGDISAINPADIESMSVLKDASASALYGARGANGVVMITTKKGKAGATSVALKATWGISSRSIPKYDRVNEAQYMELAYESIKNALIYDPWDPMSVTEAKQEALSTYMNEFGGEKYNPFNMASTQLIDPETGKINPNAKLRYHDDWFDEATRNAPLRQEYQLSVSGGHDKTNYMFSLGYLDEKGLAINTGFERYSGRINVDSQLKNWLKAGLSSSFSMTKQQYMQEGGTAYYNIWYSSMMIAPIYPVYERDANGEYLNGEKQYDYGAQRPSYNNMNWIAALSDDKRELKGDNLSARTYWEIGDKNNEALGFFKDFRFTVNLGIDYRNSNRLIYQNPYVGNAAGVNGNSYRSSNRVLSYTFNQLLNYNRTFNKHELDVLAGHEYYSFTEQFLEAQRQGFPFGGSYELANGASITEGSSYKNEYNIESVFSRINYNYDGKYYLSGSFRTDGSSRFYKDNRWGKFWSLGGAWRISEEYFMEDTSDWLSNLTLKVSYGVQGNDNLIKANSDIDEPDFYAWQGLYDMKFSNAYMSGAFLSSLENKDLKWEKNKNLNAGFEANLFSSRLLLSFDYFVKKTSDLLLLRPMPNSTGFLGYYDNVGNMRNRGFEITVSGDIIKNKDFTWNSSFIVTSYKNKVTKLSDTGSSNRILVGSTRVLQVGKPINSFYLAETAGVNPETGLMQYWITDTEGERVKTESYNTANANHRKISGSSIPDFSGSFTNSFRYRDFDMSVLLTYSVGGKVYDSTYANLMDMRDAGSAWHKDMLGRWQEPGDNAKYPRLELGTSGRVNDSYLLDASYLSFKNINFGYNLPRAWMNKVGIENLRFFAVADNLYTITAKKGMDPQYNFIGTQDYKYTPNRTISLGVDLKF